MISENKKLSVLLGEEGVHTEQEAPTSQKKKTIQVGEQPLLVLLSSTTFQSPATLELLFSELLSISFLRQAMGVISSGIQPLPLQLFQLLPNHFYLLPINT